MFFDSGKVTSTLGKEPTVIRTREKLKKEAAKEDWTKKRQLRLLIFNRWLNKILNY